jgi:hypothetical protein
MPVYVALRDMPGPQRRRTVDGLRRLRSALDRHRRHRGPWRRHYLQWRTHQLSDHLPMWLEMRTDYSDDDLTAPSG